MGGAFVPTQEKKINLLTIRQKGESQNGCYKKTKHVSVGKKSSFFGKFAVLCFLVTPVLRFAYLPHYRRIIGKIHRKQIP